MTFLVLAVGIQVAMAAVLKIGELYQQDRLVVMGFNYLFAALIAAIAWGLLGTGLPSPTTAILGIVGGFFWAIGLFLWMGAIAEAGLAVSTTAIRLSVIWPTLVSLGAFGEIPGVLQLTGVALTFGVLALLCANAFRISRLQPGSGGLRLLVATFVLNGGVGIIQKLFTEWSPPQEKMALLVGVFGTAMVICAVGVTRRRRRMRRGDVLRGFLFGFGNVCSNGALLMGLERVPGTVAFPFTNVAVILATSLLSLLAWRERPGLLGAAAIGMAAVAVVLLTR